MRRFAAMFALVWLGVLIVSCSRPAQSDPTPAENAPMSDASSRSPSPGAPAGESESPSRQPGASPAASPSAADAPALADDLAPRRTELATLGGGCFWCIEAVFERVRGVAAVESGYSGGHVKNPTYEQVCTGTTGHAEVCQIRFDPEQVSYEQLLDVFFSVHDPTTLNRQGADVGPQYRSVIFYHDEAQRRTAEQTIRRLTESNAFRRKIVTAIEPFEAFYPAEEDHQGYFRRNPGKGYCTAVIRPKVQKFEKDHPDRLKADRATR